MQYLGYIYTKKLLIIYLKLRFNWGFDTLLVLHWRRYMRKVKKPNAEREGKDLKKNNFVPFSLKKKRCTVSNIAVHCCHPSGFWDCLLPEELDAYRLRLSRCPEEVCPCCRCALSIFPGNHITSGKH